MAQLRELLTIPQVAGLLKVTPDWVRLRIRRRELRAFRLGVYLRISLEDLMAFLAGHLVRDPSQDATGQMDAERWLEERLRELGEPGRGSGEATGGAK